LRAVEIGADTLQIFTASPRMWRAGTPKPAQVDALRAIRLKHNIHPLVVHVNYLVNLASRDPRFERNPSPRFVGSWIARRLSARNISSSIPAVIVGRPWMTPYRHVPTGCARLPAVSLDL